MKLGKGNLSYSGHLLLVHISKYSLEWNSLSLMSVLNKILQREAKAKCFENAKENTQGPFYI